MAARRTASEDYGMIAVSSEGMGARDLAGASGAQDRTTCAENRISCPHQRRDFAELRAHARAKVATDVTETKQSHDAQIQLHENWKAPGGQGYTKVRRQRRSFHFEKIERAVRDELEAGGTVTGLRPVELRRRLITRMLLRGLKESEIPSVRVFGRYFA